MIEPGNHKMTVIRQCDLLGLCRASYYYESVRDDSYNQLIMNLIDEQFTKTPFYGVPRTTECLRNQGYEVNHKRVRRLMRKMGLEAIYPKKKLSKAHPDHKIYPYLLRDVVIDHSDQAWSLILRMFACSMALFIFARLWIGIAAMSWLGISQSQWMPPSAQVHWRRP